MAMSVGTDEAPSPLLGVRVLIVDDQHLFADAIRWTLQRLGMTVVAVATTGEEALTVARRELPDLVLLDLRLPGADGIEIGAAILEERPDVKVLAVTAMRDPRAMKDVVAAGFRGYLTKDTPMAQFADSIRLVLAGHVVVPDGLARSAVGGRSHREQQAALLAGELTSRELEVLTLLSHGASTDEVASGLAITSNTVRTHIQGILTKLQVHSRLEAVAFALRYGVVDPPGDRFTR